MSTERAIIEFVTQGTAEAESASDKITVDLVTAEKAGVSAKEAADTAKDSAKEAQVELKNFAREMRHGLHALHKAAELAKSLAKSAGVDDLSTAGRAIEAGTSAIGGAARGARVGAFLGPEGALVGAGLGALGALVASLHETSKKLEEREEKLRDIDAKSREHEIETAMLRQAGLAKADFLFGGGSRQVQ